MAIISPQKNSLSAALINTVMPYRLQVPLQIINKFNRIFINRVYKGVVG
jgi:hypothetical protein